jgi:transcriptional regulator with XRE-family HTH domain
MSAKTKKPAPKGRPKTHEKTQKQIAEAAGVTVNTLLQWRKLEGVDIWDEAAVMERAKKTKERRESAEDEKEAKLRKLTAEANLKEHELAVKRGEFVSSIDMDMDGVKIGMAVAAVFAKMPDELAPLLAGRTAAEIKKTLTKYSREKRTELSLYESKIKIRADG